MCEAMQQAETISANPLEAIRELSLKVQAECNRVTSLASAVDRELENPCTSGTVSESRMIDFLRLLEEAAEKAGSMAERIEGLTMRDRR